MAQCKRCGVTIYPDDEYSWFDETGGDGCDAGVHEPDNTPNTEFKVEYIGPFINVYLIDKAYGGPEEGGWWYEYGKVIRSKQVVPIEVEAAKETELLWCDEENKHRRSDIGSVLSEGMYVVYVEDEPGADFPTHTPHYE